MSDDLFKAIMVGTQLHQSYKLDQLQRGQAQQTALTQEQLEVSYAQRELQMQQLALQEEEARRKQASRQAVDQLADALVDYDQWVGAGGPDQAPLETAYQARLRLGTLLGIDRAALERVEEKRDLQNLIARLETLAQPLSPDVFDECENRTQEWDYARQLWIAAARERLISTIDLDGLQAAGHPLALREAGDRWDRATRLLARFGFYFPNAAKYRGRGTELRRDADALPFEAALREHAAQLYGETEFPGELDQLAAAVAEDRARFGTRPAHELEQEAAERRERIQELGTTLLGGAFDIPELPVGEPMPCAFPLERLVAIRRDTYARATQGLRAIEQCGSLAKVLDVVAVAAVLALTCTLWYQSGAKEREAEAARIAEEIRIDQARLKAAQQIQLAREADRIAAEQAVVAQRQAEKAAATQARADQVAARQAVREERAFAADLKVLARDFGEAFARARFGQLTGFKITVTAAEAERASTRVRDELSAAGFPTALGAPDFTAWTTNACGLTTTLRPDLDWKRILNNEEQRSVPLAVAMLWMDQLRAGRPLPGLVDLAADQGPARLREAWDRAMPEATRLHHRDGEVRSLAFLQTTVTERVARELKRKPRPADAEIVTRITQNLQRDSRIRKLAQLRPDVSVENYVRQALQTAAR